MKAYQVTLTDTAGNVRTAKVVAATRYSAIQQARKHGEAVLEVVEL